MSNNKANHNQIIKKGKLKQLVSNYQSSDVVSQMESAIATSQVSKIDVSELELFPLFSRKNYDMESINIIERSIKTQGVIVPIFIYKYQGKNMVINGVKRYLALEHLKEKSVSAVYLKCQLEEIFFYVLNNMISNKDNGLVQAHVYSVLMNDFGYTEKDIRQMTRLSHGQINNTLRLLKLCPSVSKLVVESKLSNAKARLLVPFGEVEQETLAELFLLKSVRDCEILAREYKEGNKLVKYNFNYKIDGKRITIDARNEDTIKDIIVCLEEKRIKC